MLVCAVVTLVAVLQASSWVDPARHQTRMVNVADGVQLEVLDFGGTGRARSPPFTLPEAERRQPRGEKTAREAIPAGGRQFASMKR